ncbi:MAG: IS91 family transposase [Planctomycetota bacterium]
MVRPRFEVADVVRAHGEEFLRRFPTTSAERRVLAHIAACRTSALGGHVDRCDACQRERVSYNSCRDRHCPKCQGTERARWIERRLQQILPVPYFHVVFTLPAELNPLVRRNKRLLFGMLFRVAASTLTTIAADERRLGAQLGFTVVLHSWGQQMLFHPHVHCVVTGGGLSTDGGAWITARERYLLPVRVLAKLFRGRFLDLLHRAWCAGDLRFGGSTAALAMAKAWASLKDKLYRKDWVVHAKPPFGGARHVFRYLGGYTHRVAISNHRIVEFRDGQVSFKWKDYADGGQRKTMTLDALEFLRRFLLHVLPRGFVRVRHYGLHASGHGQDRLERARELLAPGDRARSASAGGSSAKSWIDWLREWTGVDALRCSYCGAGRLTTIQVLPSPRWRSAPRVPARGPPCLC